MTYCLGMRLHDGLVLAADTRTNAGVDHVSTFRKMHLFTREGERVFALMSAGNLAITQAVVNRLEEAVACGGDETETLWTVTSMVGAARTVGAALRKVHDEDAEALRKHDTDFTATFLLGGQLKGERPRLFMIYAAGNFIEASEDSPFLQIGETKYGKPILDRVITPATPLAEAAKCALVSFDSTMRSNLSVGMPIDMLVYRADSLHSRGLRRVEETDPYVAALRSQWGEGVRQLFGALPTPDWAG